jgi:hypothetical protein
VLSSAISFIVASPIVLLIAAIVGLVTLIATKGDQIKAILQKVDDFLKNIFTKDWVPVLGGKNFGFNLSHLGKIAYLAQGGILSSGSAIVGERGPELLSMSNGRAVVQPLTNNTTTNKNYGGVTLNIYGAAGQSIQDLAEIIMDEIGDATRRREAAL